MIYTVHNMNGALDVHAVNAVDSLRWSEADMDRVLPGESVEDERIVLSILNSVENDGSRSQRHMAAELGIALGLVNAYLKRCVRKGLVKVSTAPARRYAYYLTPHGFAEKSRLTVEYLSSSFSFFRQAKSDCAEVFRVAEARNFHDLVLVGKSDLTEVAILSAADSGISIVAVVDDEAGGSQIAGKMVVPSYDKLMATFDAVVITDLRRVRHSFDDAVARFGALRVLAPKLLGLNLPAVGGDE
jgi:DNA-binding MarR family transcriptional regulator